MVRSYFRHGPTEAFGLIASSSSPSLFDGKFAYVPALEDVLVWDTKKGEMVAMWHETGLRSEVTFITRSPANKDMFAVGYANGSIRIWSAKSKSVNIVFNGHRKAVTALAFDRDGSRLASGGLDTEIVLWDVIGESGLFRLRGHRGQITALSFLPSSTSAPSTSSIPPSSNRLLSASKDTYMKLWDLSTQHCIDTVVAHRQEIWSLEILQGNNSANSETPDEIVVVTGGGEGECKAWSIPPSASLSDDVEVNGNGTTKDINSGRIIKSLASSLGLATAAHTQRVNQIHYHPNTSFLALQTGEKTIEVLRLRKEEEIRKKIARRRRRERDKKDKKKEKENGSSKIADSTEMDVDEADNNEEEHFEWKNRLASWITIRTTGKIRSFHWDLSNMNTSSKTKYEAQLLVAMSTNSLEVYGFPSPGPSKIPQEATRLHGVDIPGHRTDVRTLSVSSDDQLVASASNGSLKIWNIKTSKCLRTIDCGYALSSAFLPGDRHIIIGTKSGQISLYDIAASSLIENYDAHSGPVWSIQIRPDGRGAVSGSADKDVKFWDFEVRDNNEDSVVDGQESLHQDNRQLTMVHVRTLKMTDDVLGVKYSPNGVLLAVALLDSTVKVFYSDTLKFSLSLYGHKLPVLSLDISSDSKLIVTCSADKNVKIWGLDFGDCHRSLFAHNDSIMQVAFEKSSHYFWTVSKDKILKYWDGDKFECIQKLEGHHSEIWALAVSNQGKFVITASHDKSIRVWEKLDEELFLEEERERELEELFDSAMISNDQEFSIQRPGEAVERSEVASVRQQTSESLTSGERIIEALDIAEADRVLLLSWKEDMDKLSPEEQKKFPRPKRNAIFTYYDIPAPLHVLQVVRKIPSSTLQDSLLVLPFAKIGLLLNNLDYWAEKSLDITLTSRILFFLLEVHHNQIISNRMMRDVLLNLRRNLRQSLKLQKDTIGYNVAALKYLKAQNDAERMGSYLEQENFNEAKVKERIAEAAKKRKRGVIKS